MPSKKKAKPVTSRPPKSSTAKDSPYVSYDQLIQCVDALKKWTQLGDSERKSGDKKPLFADIEDSVVRLQINHKKTLLNKSTYIYGISLPNHWRHELSADYETCLIVKDLQKTPLSDRDLDLTETKNHYREVLSKAGADQLVTEVLPMRELRNEYKLYEAKERLSKAYHVFLCESQLLRNKFDYLPTFLGKSFWISNRKVPLPVDTTSPSLKQDLESRLNQTQLYLSGNGDSSAVTIGLLKQSTERLADNLLAVTRRLALELGTNVRSLSLKTDKSIAFSFFMDCGFIGGVTLERKSRDNKGPIEDEFSHFVNSNIQVFSNGDIRVVPKQEETADGDEKADETESKWLSETQRNDSRKKSKNKRLSLYSNKANKRRKVENKSVDQIKG